MTKLFGGTVFAIAFLASQLLTAPVSADDVPSTKMLPSDVYVYFSMPSVTEMKARWGRTEFSKITKDPAFGEFFEKLEELMGKASRDFERETGMKLDDVLNLPTGEVSFALVKPPRGQLAAVSFVDFGKSEDTVDELLSKLEDALDKENADRKVQEHQNTRIVVYTFPEAEKEKMPIKANLTYFVKDTKAVFSNDPAALEAVLDRWDGKAPRTFADNSVYKRIMENCKIGEGEPLMKYYFNPIEMLKVGLQMGAQENPQVMVVMGVLPFLGLNGLRGMGGASDWAVDGYESVSRTMIAVDQPPQGLLNMFLFPETDLTPPKWVTAATQTYMGANWDVDAAYEAVDALLAIFQGAGALDRIVDDIADSPNGPGIHIKKDILDELTGKFHVINDGAEIQDNQPPKVKFMVSIGVKNPKNMQDLIAKIIKSQNLPAETRDFRGATIIEFDAGATAGGLSVFNNALMISSDVSMLEQVIRGDGAQKPLAESPIFQQMVKNFPAKTSMLSFQNNDQQIKVLFDTLKKGEFDNNDLPPEAKELIETLPGFEALEKYLPIAGSYTVPDENGVIFVNLSQVKK